MFESTQEERRKATELGIMVGNQSGPQLSEDIRKAHIRSMGAAVSSELRELAERFDVEIRATDRSPSLRRRLTARLEALIAERGFAPGAKLVITVYGDTYELSLTRKTI